MDFKSLICEQSDKLSLGRVSFWLFFFVMLYRAAFIGVVDTSLLTILAMEFFYAGYKKHPVILDAALKVQQVNNQNTKTDVIPRQLEKLTTTAKVKTDESDAIVQ